MKAKYKIDELVQYGTPAGVTHGAITGVIKRKDGFSYEVTENEAEVAENDIMAAFKPKTQKVVKEKKAGKSRKSAKVTDQETVTQQ